MAAIRTADNPRALESDLLASRQLRTRASQLAYLQFERAKLTLTHWIAKWVERLQLRPEKRPIKKPAVTPIISLTISLACFTYAYHPQ
jgi:hypothetical protein